MASATYKGVGKLDIAQKKDEVKIFLKHGNNIQEEVYPANKEGYGMTGLLL